MTATSLDELRPSAPTRKIADEKMEQVRELLLGEDLRRTDERLAALESHLQSLQDDVYRRLDAMQARLDALAGEVNGNQRAAFDELSKGISDLGQRVKNLSRI